MDPEFSWLCEWRPEQLRGILVDIFDAEQAGAALRRVEEAEAVAGEGLAADSR